MKKYCLLLFILTFMPSFKALAKMRDSMEVKEIAMKYVEEYTKKYKKTKCKLSANECCIILSLHSLSVVKTKINEIVVVANSNTHSPILGYSSDFDSENCPSGFRWWLETANRALTIKDSSNNLFEKVSANSSMASYVQPLLTSIWDQKSPYNNMCPDRCVTGCVATAMAQILYYYKYPTYGKGSSTVEYNGKQITEYFDSTYDWDNMIDTYMGEYTMKQANAVSKLMYHCGVAVNMAYGKSESSAYYSRIASALKNYFSYSYETTHAMRSTFSDENWMSLIYKNLSKNQPIIYSGHSATNSKGHTFVLDGYDTNGLIHINWGWSGSCNGYFDLSQIYIPSKDVDYNDEQNMCYNIRPQQEGDSDSFEYVDLGLPSHKLWAKTNFGASSEEEFGSYVKWDDAYRLKSEWGNEWNVPDIEDIIELQKYCNTYWDTLNGVNGLRVVGKNGWSIFLPAAGYELQIIPYVISSGSLVACWSATLHDNDPKYHCALVARSNNIETNILYNIAEHNLPIRPVRLSLDNDAIESMSECVNTRIYNLSGIRRHSTERGLNIIVKNGKRALKIVK